MVKLHADNDSQLLKYDVTLKSHVVQAWPIMIFILLFVTIPAVAYYSLGIGDLEFSIAVATILFLLILIPHSLIHWRYWLVNSDVSVEFNVSDREILYRLGDQAKTVRDNDILSVDMVVPQSIANQGLAAFPWQQYGYATLNLASGEKLVITSLVVPELDFPYKFRDVRQRISIYCWPPSSTVS